MAGDDMARNTLGIMDAKAGNMERAIEHWTIAASAGSYMAMHHLILYQLIQFWQIQQCLCRDEKRSKRRLYPIHN